MRRSRLVPFAAVALGFAVLATSALLALTPRDAAEAGDVAAGGSRGSHRTVDRPITFAAVGDSITAWTDRYTGEPRGELSWTYWADSDRTSFVGGYARSAATSANMLAEMAPGIDALTTADVDVIMAGTNDVTQLVDYATSMANIDAIAAAGNASTIVLCAIAPSNANPQRAAVYNIYLRAHANARGWLFVDPWVAVRTDDGRYLSGSNKDDLHPTAATQSIVGAVIRSAIIHAIG